MRVTLKLLEQWGACPRFLEWMKKHYPEGHTDTIAGLVSRIPEEWPYDGLWFLHEVAKRVDGAAGDDALVLLTERADPSRLAKAVTEITRRDTTAALDKLIASDDLMAVHDVAQRATGEAAARALSAIEAKGVV